jgi:hypothetical protein
MTPGLGVRVIDEASDKERMFEGKYEPLRNNIFA